MHFSFIVTVFFFIIPFKNVAIGILTDAERKSALDNHNLKRSQLANGMSANKTGTMPTGKNIWTMLYDTAQEASVQSWLDKCTFNHSGNYENLYWIGIQQTKVAALKSAIDLWWSELVNVGAPADLVLPSVNWQPIGHWSAMAWATTNKVGCGVAYCMQNGVNYTYAGCQYRPTGNYLGQKIYESGAVCSGCPVVNGQLQCQYGLCI